MILRPVTSSSPTTEWTFETGRISTFGLDLSRFITAVTISSSLCGTIVTLVASSARWSASSAASLSEPTTATFLPLKKLPSQVAQ